jgi:beta-N-acetylhexosaminidase
VLYRAFDQELPATLSPTIINDFLRQELQYDGVVLTDDLEMHAIIDHYGVEDAAVRAVLAGCDVLLICKDRDREVAAFGAVEQAVASGTISAERLDLSAARIARLKARFVSPYKPVIVSDAKIIAGCRTHQALVHTIEQVQTRLSNQKYS